MSTIKIGDKVNVLTISGEELIGIVILIEGSLVDIKHDKGIHSTSIHVCRKITNNIIGYNVEGYTSEEGSHRINWRLFKQEKRAIYFSKHYSVCKKYRKCHCPITVVPYTQEDLDEEKKEMAADMEYAERHGL